MKEVYELNYYDADSGGMRTLHSGKEYVEGTIVQACDHAETQKSLWGFNYTVGTLPLHGTCIVTPTTEEIIALELEIEAKQKKLEMLKENV